VHPVSGAIVLVAAGVEVLDWAQVAAEHLMRLAEFVPGAGG